MAAPYRSAEIIAAPIDGTLMRIEDVADPVFSLELLGRSAAIEPSSSELRAPIAGTVTVLPDTLHALGISAPGGPEVLVHMGIDTVGLRGAPFMAHVRIGSHVEVGDLVATIDWDAIRAAGLHDTVITIVLDTASYARVETVADGAITAGDALLRCIPDEPGIQSVS